MDNWDFKSFLNDSATPFHAVANAISILEAGGFKRATARGALSPAGDRVYAESEDGALLAFAPGAHPIAEGVLVLAAHTDSPSYRVKEHAVQWKSGYLVLPTEPYGSPIDASWFDRPLDVAGRAVRSDGSTKLFRLSEHVALSNVAIHLNREVNKGAKYNRQDHLTAIAGSSLEQSPEDAADVLMGMIGRSIDTDPNEILEIDAFLSVAQTVTEIGRSGEVFIGPRIDNLAGCYASLQALLADSQMPRVLALFAHEEIGSLTGVGAQSSFLKRFLERIGRAEGLDSDQIDEFLGRSRVLSNDASHALHPNYTDRYDPQYSPQLGGGPVLKMSASYRYATTTRTATEFRLACDRAGVPMQRQRGRSDMRSGSTIGAIAWARAGIPTVDVGIGILGMHSAVETGDLRDVDAMIRALTAYEPLTAP